MDFASESRLRSTSFQRPPPPSLECGRLPRRPTSFAAPSPPYCRSLWPAPPLPHFESWLPCALPPPVCSAESAFLSAAACTSLRQPRPSPAIRELVLRPLPA